MAGIIIVLSIILVVFTIYIVYLQLQIRSVNRQLSKRLKENTRQPVSLELMNPDLSKLAVNINKCLKAEETLRLNGIREEKKFRVLIADISHDLRTPLTAIKGYLQLLDTKELSIDQYKKLHVARKHVEELGQLIDRFFEYAYLINSDPMLHTEKINLTKFVTEGLISFIATLEEHNLAVCFNEDTPPIYIEADSEMTTRIIQNLIRNCIQHSSGDIIVELSVQKQVMLSIKNPVSNPDEIDVNRLFDRFYTGDRARNHSTGLGLAIVKLLAEQMGGSVSAALKGNYLEIMVAFLRTDIIK